MDKPKKRRALEEFTIREEWADDTPEAQQHLERGLRILAKLIARRLIRENSAHSRTCNERDRDSEEEPPMAIMVDQQQEKLAITVDEAAKLLGVGRNVTYEAVRTGQIPSIRIGRRIIIPRAALLNMLKKADVEKAGGAP
jgi:excisionase family DNA binding protein